MESQMDTQALILVVYLGLAYLINNLLGERLSGQAGILTKLIINIVGHILFITFIIWSWLIQDPLFTGILVLYVIWWIKILFTAVYHRIRNWLSPEK